ncbi:hypothetical protein DY000_02049860 [Brassica cretica]|uniref:Jacalin-type lectin domain-containing protein n=1 Tax=Brassica cretica TaxID=69181 RepID=A0ABQ7F122_BRACR|nr:hypothetical protein DY000_02049860 [Brassica cretica]
MVGVKKKEKQRGLSSVFDRPRHLPYKVRQCEVIKLYNAFHCDGLLLCVMENQLLVWNPLLKETSWIKCGSDFHRRDDAYSLGYLSHCDYRILRFRCARRTLRRSLEMIMEKRHYLHLKRFTTNKRTSPPFGLEGAKSILLKENGHKVVGFHGKAGADILHQVGVHVKPISK